MLHIPVSQIFIRLSVRFNPKQKTSTFDPFMDLFLYTCPLILSEFFPSLFCGGCSRRPPAALTQNSGWPSFREAQFDPQPVFFLLTRIRPGQSRRKPPSPCYHRHPSLFALSFIWRLSVLNTSQPEQNTEVNHHHRPWTPCYIPKDTRESLGKWSLLSPHTHIPSWKFVSNVEWCVAALFPHRGQILLSEPLLNCCLLTSHEVSLKSQTVSLSRVCWHCGRTHTCISTPCCSLTGNTVCHREK